MRAEKLFINGNIYTMDDEKTHAEALATTGQTILAVGSTVELMDLAGPDTEVIDRDYMDCPVVQIKDIKALMTVIGGEIVYERKGE